MLDAPKFLELIPRDVFINHMLPYFKLSELRTISLTSKYFFSIINEDNYKNISLDKFYRLDVNFLPFKVKIAIQIKVNTLLNRFFIYNDDSNLIFFCPQKCIMDFLFSNEHRAQRSLINKSHIRLLKAACRNDMSRLHALVCEMDEQKKAVLRQLSININYYYPVSVIAGAVLLEDCKLTYDYHKLLDLIKRGAVPNALDMKNEYIAKKHFLEWNEKEKLILFQKILNTYQSNSIEALNLCTATLNNSSAKRWFENYIHPATITSIHEFKVELADDLDDFNIKPLKGAQLPINVNSFNKLANLPFLAIITPDPNLVRYLNIFKLNTHGNSFILCYIVGQAKQTSSLTAASEELPLNKLYLSKIMGALLENGLDLRDGLLWKNLWRVIRYKTQEEEHGKQILYVNKYLKPLCPIKEVVEKQYNKIFGPETIVI